MSPVVLTVEVGMKQPNEHGLTSKAEWERYESLSDALAEHVASNMNVRHVATVTGQGRWLFLFYGRDGGRLEEVVAAALRQHSEYEPTTKYRSDPEWAAYRQFLPNDEQWNAMRNARVTRHLQAEGDSLTVPRETDHWAYFPTEQTRDAFIKKIEELGFIVRGKPNDDRIGAVNPSSVQFWRMDAVDPESFDPVTLELKLLASEAGGDYDGWETAVVKPESH